MIGNALRIRSGLFKWPRCPRFPSRNMTFRKTILLFTCLLALVVLPGCDRDQKAAFAANAAPKTVDEHFAIRVGNRTVSMQVAALSEEMQKGLMHRLSLGEDEGMIFVFDTPQRMSF